MVFRLVFSFFFLSSFSFLGLVWFGSMRVRMRFFLLGVMHVAHTHAHSPTPPPGYWSLCLPVYLSVCLCFIVIVISCPRPVPVRPRARDILLYSI